MNMYMQQPQNLAINFNAPTMIQPHQIASVMGHGMFENMLDLSFCTGYTLGFALILNVVGIAIMLEGIPKHSAQWIIGGGMTAEVACALLVAYAVECFNIF